MKTESHHLSRREALLSALKGAVTVAVSAPVIVQAAPAARVVESDPEFVPENDYPYFGYEPDPMP